MLLAGTLPGVIAGSVIRVYVLPGPVVFDFVVAAVLIPLGAGCVLTRCRSRQRTGPPGPADRAPCIGGDRRRRGLCRRHLRHRRRIDPRPDPGRRRAAAIAGRARRAQLDVRSPRSPGW